jgi:enamine deaminase RidA (YjgF/YER057c/UK114 family)
MHTQPTGGRSAIEQTGPVGAEQRLVELGVVLPPPPEPFGTYVMAVQAGSLLFLTGMLPTEGRTPKYLGRVGAEMDAGTANQAARAAVLNGLALARQHLGSLDRIKRIVRLGAFVATVGDIRDHPKVADGASDLLQEVFGAARNPCRLVLGVASLPLGVPVELELIFEI